MGTRVASDPNIKANWAFVKTKRRSEAEDEMVAWCLEHSKGRFAIDFRRPKDGSWSWEYGFFFKGVKDAFMFKMIFGGE